ncbi:MAG: galactitol system component [Eubacteriaceae bacterium]|jgi:PTS system galactitol-specific IIA component|nr:galactitol system component [Eubacteriaceae bacterium]MDK2905811.1 galactitol system component [Eubacteriaceae bacterium]MDK2936257.1 galactitol system component [Eubacteriaceae bacterium]MDN5308170.1 galactitol system component [Eubacteriaceae bacterium]
MEDLIKKIQVNCQADNQIEAIEIAALPLLEKKIVKESFVAAVLEREKTFPTGLPASIGVAISHTDSKHVIDEGISIVTLKKPVEFRGMGNPKEIVAVEIIILLAIKNPAKQLGILQKIITIIQNKEMLEKIKAAQDPERVYNLIRTFKV